jgi:transcription initiation factor IIE alpha subunit
MKPELKKILDIVAELADKNVKKDVLETDIITRSGLADAEVRKQLNDLEWLHLVKEVQPRPSRTDWRLWTITENGLREV